MAKLKLSRRSVLRGAGVTLALPLLECMFPTDALAQAALVKPRVFANVWPNGHPRVADPTRPGCNSGFLLTELLAVATPAVRAVSGLVSKTNRAYKNDSSRGANQVNHHISAWLGVLSGIGANVNAWNARGRDPAYLMSETFDQRIARHFGLKSISAGLQNFADPTSSYIYNVNGSVPLGRLPSENISWSDAGNGAVRPVEALYQPRDLFDRLTGLSGSIPGTDVTARRQLLSDKKLVLDAVLSQIKTVQSNLGSQDKTRLDAYLTKWEELDRKTASDIAALGSTTGQAAACTTGNRPRVFSTSFIDRQTGVEFVEKYRLFTDMFIQAMLCDQFQVFSLANGITANLFPLDMHVATDSPDRDWHGASHWNQKGGGGEAQDPAISSKELAYYMGICRLQVRLFTEFMNKLAATQTVAGRSLLADTVAVTTTEFCDDHGDQENGVIMTGNASGRLASLNGGYIQNGSPVPLANLWLTILNRLGIAETRFGSSTGTIAGL